MNWEQAQLRRLIIVSAACKKKIFSGLPSHRLHAPGWGRGREVKVYNFHKFITIVTSQLNNIKRLMKPFYNSHLPEQWLMRLHLKHKRPGALDARDCFIIINVSASPCTRRSRIAPSRAHWSLKIWHERDLAGYCDLTRSVILGWWIVPNFFDDAGSSGVCACAKVSKLTMLER